MNDDPLGWMAHSDLRDGVTVTVVRGGDLDTVLAAFGAEGAGLPVDDPQIQWAAWESEGPLPWAVIAPVEGGVIAVEPNGFAGVAPPVLRVASRDALAVAVYWNVNLLTDVKIAEVGAVLGGISDLQVRGGERFAETIAPLGLPGELDPLQIVAWGLRVQAEVAGLALTEELWRDLQARPCAYLLFPPLPEHYEHRHAWREDVASLTEPAIAAAEALVRDLAWHAAAMAAGTASTEDDVARTLAARRLDDDADRAARRALAGHGKRLVLWRMLHSATNPDAPSALLQVLQDARFLLDGASFDRLLAHAREELGT